MIRSARKAIAWMPVFRNLGLTSLQLSMRVREAGFRRYSAKPEHVSPHYNRHRYRHILVAFSPGGILPLPFPVWLGFPDGILIIFENIYRSDARHACVFVFSGLGSCGALCNLSHIGETITN